MGLVLLPILIVYVVVILGVTFLLVIKQKNQSRKILFSLIMVAIFFVAPILDQVIGKIYFKRLCSSERGLVIYDKAILNDLEFDEKGNLKYYNSLNNFFDFNYKDKYKTGIKIDNKYLYIGIEKNSVYIKNTETNKVLSEYVNYSFVGGVLSRLFSRSITGGSISCDRIDQKDMDEMVRNSFIAR